MCSRTVLRSANDRSWEAPLKKGGWGGLLLTVPTPLVWGLYVGGDLLSHTLPGAVPSALEGLASGFGKGPGVSHSAITTDTTITLFTLFTWHPPTTTWGIHTARPHPAGCPGGGGGGCVFRVTQWMRTRLFERPNTVKSVGVKPSAY